MGIVLVEKYSVVNVCSTNKQDAHTACEGEIQVTDPTHPLFGRTLKMVGLANLPGHVRHCQVEIRSDQIIFIPVACTHLSSEPRPLPTLLNPAAVAELVAIFQAARVAAKRDARRKKHATSAKSGRVGGTSRKRTRRRS